MDRVSSDRSGLRPKAHPSTESLRSEAAVVASSRLLILRRNATLYALGIAGIFAVFLAVNAIRFGPAVRWRILTANAVILVTMAALLVWLRRSPPRSVPVAHGILAAMHLVVLGNVVTVGALTENALQTVFVALVLVSLGCVILSWRWLGASLAACFAVWLSVVGLIERLPGPEIGLRASYLLGAGLLSLLVHGLRRQSLDTVDSLRTAAERSAARERELSDSLTRSEARYRELVDGGLGLVWSHSIQGRIRSMNRTMLAALGFSSELEVVGRSFGEFWVEGEADGFSAYLAELRERRQSSGTLELCGRGGRRVIVEYRNVVLRADGSSGEIVALCHGLDITDSVRLRDIELRQGEIFRTLIENLPAPVALFDDQMRYLAVSGGWARIQDKSSEELLGRPYEGTEPGPEGLWRGIHRRCLAGAIESSEGERFERPDGTIEWLRWWAGPWHRADGSVGGLLVTREDITAQKEAEALLRRAAETDPLTGLANRAGFLDRGERLLRRAVQEGQPVSLLFLDLDDFKEVNDTHGHGVGDEVLSGVADRVVGAVRPGDLVARLGGDEFLILIPGGEKAAVEVRRRVLAALARPMQIGDRDIRASVSIGIAPATGDCTLADLLRQGDEAMYRDKAG